MDTYEAYALYCKAFERDPRVRQARKEYRAALKAGKAETEAWERTDLICAEVMVELKAKYGLSALTKSVTEVIEMKTYRLVWSPEGREIARVEARTAREAIRKAPQPYRKYLGEIYAEEV